MDEYLNSIQPGLAEIAAAIFNGDTATCKVKSENGFYLNQYVNDNAKVYQQIIQ